MLDKEQVWKGFLSLLQTATKEIEDKYFLLPISGEKDPIYRERVYCYELYHRLRCKWNDHCPGYTLCGELDKARHKVSHDCDGLYKVKPDFLVHVPGNMNDNLIAMEVKPATTVGQGLEKDVKTLTAFVTCGQYFRALLLIYGEAEQGSRNTQLSNKLSRICHDHTNIQVWRHEKLGQPAYQIRR